MNAQHAGIMYLVSGIKFETSDIDVIDRWDKVAEDYPMTSIHCGILRDGFGTIIIGYRLYDIGCLEDIIANKPTTDSIICELTVEQREKIILLCGELLGCKKEDGDIKIYPVKGWY